MTLETFKGLTISKDNLYRRCKFNERSLALFDEYQKANQSAILTMGHLGNWEWSGSSFSILNKHHLYVLYHPLTNKHFDRLIYNMRTRFGTGLIPMRTAFKEMLKNRNELTLTGFISDQTPSPKAAHWMQFLNQDTPVFKGTEVIAKKLNLPILYATIKRVKRGFYEINIEELVKDSKNTEDGYITELHTKRLEKDILAQPEVWIWSHRRWKHKRNKTSNA